MKPSLPQGTRDFGAATVYKRQHIFNTIRSVFELYGFQPLETPAMENLQTLMGKYGEEGDKLIFKVLNNGLNNADKANDVRAGFEQVMQGRNDLRITERALRYDLTIPFARYVAMNHNQLSFPFKRYQIQPVWRADRPQKGRYREFYQCDADVVGSRSLLNEQELVEIYHTALTRLGLKDYELRINNRKILTGLAELCGGAEQMMSITIAIDKLDKIGLEKVQVELSERGLNEEQVEKITAYLQVTGDNAARISRIRELLEPSATAMEGLNELEEVLKRGGKANVVADFTLARGLNYYTGTIFEVKAPPTVAIGSIGGGGRYDDLTGLFGVPNVPGVGISFGVDRIYDVLEALNLFPAAVQQSTRVLFLNLGEAESGYAYTLLSELRAAGVAGELYHEAVKFDKQFKYAEKKGIPFVAIVGSEEMASGTVKLKNLSTGMQEAVASSDLLSHLQ